MVLKFIKFELKLGASAYHSKAFSVLQVNMVTLYGGVERPIKFNVLKLQLNSELAALTFIMPQKNDTTPSQFSAISEPS